MSSPRLICKSGYITSIRHFFNVLEYAGNKIAAQSIVFLDGSTQEAPPDKKILLSPAQQAQVAAVRLAYKDGGGRIIGYDAYCKMTESQEHTVRVDQLELVEDGPISPGPHETRDLDFFKYLSYIEGRPGVEKADGHGLFGLTGDVSIAQARAQGERCGRSRKWSHILSLDASDARRLGYDCRDAWKQLILSHAPQLALAYNIRLENLVINCAYHSNTDNPHVHLLFYSRDPREGFVRGGAQGMRRATEALKSALVNDIFKDDNLIFKQRKSQARDQLRELLDHRLRAVLKEPCPDGMARALETLSHSLEELPGKKTYAYLPPTIKRQVDAILHLALEGNPEAAALFRDYLSLHRRLIGQYVSDPQRLDEKLEAFCRDFFSPAKGELCLYHNQILRAARELSSTEWNPARPSDTGAPPEECGAGFPPSPRRTAEGGTGQPNPDFGELSSTGWDPAWPSDADAPPKEDGAELSPSPRRTVEGGTGRLNQDFGKLSRTSFATESQATRLSLKAAGSLFHALAALLHSQSSAAGRELLPKHAAFRAGGKKEFRTERRFRKKPDRQDNAITY